MEFTSRSLADLVIATPLGRIDRARAGVLFGSFSTLREAIATLSPAALAAFDGA